jgi:hypothetical protein
MFSMSVLGRIACLTVGLSIVAAFFVGLALPAHAQGQQPAQQPRQDAPLQAQPQQQDQHQQPLQEEQSQSQSQQSVEIDTNLFCDTQQQVQRFVSLLDENGGSAEAAIASVNDENKTPDACVIATVAYRRTGTAGEVKNTTATFDVMRIVVLGVYTVRGLEPARPLELFTLTPREVTDGTVGQGSR